MSRRYAVSKEEYDLLQSAKKIQEEAKKEQFKFDQMISLEKNILNIKIQERQRAFKENELKSEITEKHNDFKDGLKPRFMVENEIDVINQNIREIQLVIDNLKKQTGEQDGGHKTDADSKEDTSS